MQVKLSASPSGHPNHSPSLTRIIALTLTLILALTNPNLPLPYPYPYPHPIPTLPLPLPLPLARPHGDSARQRCFRESRGYHPPPSRCFGDHAQVQCGFHPRVPSQSQPQAQAQSQSQLNLNLNLNSITSKLRRKVKLKFNGLCTRPLPWSPLIVPMGTALWDVGVGLTEV